MTLANTLSPSQLHAINATERVNSAISVVSIIFIAATYLTTPCFDKPINRLIFFAGFGNLGTCIAALIADVGPLAGENSAVCQTQAFIVQMFLGVDGLWAFCMAVNVLLVFRCGYSVQHLRKLDMWYLLFCYGLSLIPAFVFIFVSTTDRGRVYGPATIWCWITERWDFMRFAFLYAWIWFAIIFALAVYVHAGIVIYQRRRQLSGFLNPLNENPFKATVTTEVHVTSEPWDGQEVIETVPAVVPFETTESYQHYQTDVDIEASPQNDKQGTNSSMPPVFKVRSYTRKLAEDSIDPEAWLYARVAFLFYIALIITWIPSSINRIYSLVKPGEVSFPLSYIASFLFPLQGFWNLVVYVITSQAACRNLIRQLFYSGHGVKPTKHQVRQSVSGRLKRGTDSTERLGSEDTIVLR